MINAKGEFLEHIKGKARVRCAEVIRSFGYNKMEHRFHLERGLRPDDEMDVFLALLDFEYDNGYGGQVLYGTIWYDNGTWSDRGEYDGSEWWDYHRCPPVPKYL